MLYLDAAKMNFETTGKYRAVGKYEQLADGQRRRVPGAQACDEAGVPLWTVDAELLDEDQSDRTVIHGIKVASATEPAPPRHEVVVFEGLTCKPYVDRRTNQVGLSFSATGMTFPEARKGKTSVSSQATGQEG